MAPLNLGGVDGAEHRGAKPICDHRLHGLTGDHNRRQPVLTIDQGVLNADLDAVAVDLPPARLNFSGEVCRVLRLEFPVGGVEGEEAFRPLRGDCLKLGVRSGAPHRFRCHDVAFLNGV